MSESDFTELVQSFFTLMEQLQEAAQRVKDNGGDVRKAFLQAFPDDMRPHMEMQYPVIAMMLGV